MFVKIQANESQALLSVIDQTPKIFNYLYVFFKFRFQTIQRHFKQIPCPEKETVTYFIYMIKTHKSKLDQKPDSN